MKSLSAHSATSKDRLSTLRRWRWGSPAGFSLERKLGIGPASGVTMAFKEAP